ncbi:DUF4245 domain-containing protein [Streptomyces sp. DH24]|uniref:DUF4245 domain-containing protein n=1 Tax=Streptomyces sp. DH24 TaxID=3040123 RepID=UPI002442B608|nr:DUF4245 domain-containing protein [Streptomyces sp. DH24]MDG9716388.1 DUF4245 domain-containing protein [Streptomyces sp. DH24]
MAGRNGKQKSALDMVLSLGVILLAAGVMYLFIPHDDDKEPPVERVDYRVELLTARRAASYPVAAPVGLPDSWKPTSVRFEGDNSDAWHLGFHAPDGQYVVIKQSTGKRTQFVDEATKGSEATGTTDEIDGRTWTRYSGGRYDALVLEGDAGETTVVAGTASFAELTTMAEALEMK